MQDGKYVVVINYDPSHYDDNLPDRAKSHYPNNYGLYNMSGNVAEMVYERGVAYGGSYLDPGYDIRIDSEKPYDGPSPLIGFRVIAVRKK
jgi:formylglycine-generating enzyme required for sulfatase activity